MERFNEPGFGLRPDRWGLTPVLGVDVKYGKFNFGAKYEFKTNLNIENNTKKLDYPDSAEDLVGPYKHGVNTPNIFLPCFRWQLLIGFCPC